MASPSQPQRAAIQSDALLESQIQHLPETEQERQRAAGKGPQVSYSEPRQYTKLVPHPDPTVPPQRINVTAVEITVEPEGSTANVVTEDGALFGRTGDLLVTDPWNKQWVVSKQTFLEQGHEPIATEQPDHLKDDV